MPTTRRSPPSVLPRLALAAILALGACGDDAARRGSADEPEKSEAPFALLDASATSGLTFETRSGTAAQRTIAEVKATGVGLMDFDGDGRLDVVLSSGSDLERARRGLPGFGTRIFRNLGGLRFEDATEAAGLPATDWASAPVCADYDGDGRCDLLVTQLGRNRLFRNVGGRFEEVTEAAGLAGEGWHTSGVFHDIDGDGDLDLYVARYLAFDVENPPEHGKDGRVCIWKEMTVMCGPQGLEPQGDRVWRNEGDGTFVEVTEEWGVADLPPSYGLGVLAGDLDGDGRAEIYVANDGMPNFWLDWTGERLEDNGYLNGVAYGESGVSEAGMGVDAADLNGDGIQDLVCTNFSGELNNVYLSGDALWTESSMTSGTALVARDELGWGVGLFDFDLDGRLDFFVANGHVYPQASRSGTGTDYRQPNRLFRGLGGGRFELFDREDSTGLRVRKVSRGAAFGDLDDDGDIDVVVANLNDRPTLVETRVDREALGRRFLGVRLRGRGMNTDGLGALVSLLDREGRTVAAREARRQASFQASNDSRVHFGLGDAAVARVRVRWSDGLVETFPARPEAWSELEYGKGEKP